MMWDSLIQLVIHRGVQVPSLLPRRDSQLGRQLFLYLIVLSQLLRRSVTGGRVWGHDTVLTAQGPLCGDHGPGGSLCWSPCLRTVTPLATRQESCRGAATEAARLRCRRFAETAGPT